MPSRTRTKPLRILSVLPAATEIVTALGAGDSLVGISHQCSLPAGMTPRPCVTAGAIDGSRSAADINGQVATRAESAQGFFTLLDDRIAALHPDVIITQALCDVCAVSEGDVRALAATLAPPPRIVTLGATTLVVSNAAGGVHETLTPGTIMLLTDHVNFMFRNPLIGQLEEGDVRFPDMSEPYDLDLRSLAHRIAKEQGVALAEGVYLALLGPTYETKAEVQMLTRLGADVVGMSTVPEVIAARALGMRVLGFSCVTNVAGGLAGAPITHDEVLETTARVAARLQQLVRGVVAEL